MTRQAIRFGRGQHLIGVVHQPSDSTLPIAVILWNTGISHRIGPFRIHVELAELLAQQGFTVLRFDLSRLGDSELAEQHLATQDMFTQDINDAVQYLEDRHQISQVISLGICSGAVDAWYHACQDKRIIGLAMVDSFVYSTWRHELGFFCKRILSPQRWGRLGKRLFCPWIKTTALSPANDFLDPNYPEQSLAAIETQKLVDRGTKMLVLYTGGFHPWYSYTGQFKAMLAGVDFRRQLQLEFWPEVDHLFTLIEDRQRFLKLVQDWIKTHFPCHAESSKQSQPTLQTQSDSPSASAELELQNQVLGALNAVLNPSIIELDDNFFDFGGNSVLAIRACELLSLQLKRPIPITVIYAQLSARAIAHELLATPPLEHSKVEAEAEAELKARSSSAQDQQAIAVIGMACRVPGAKNLQEFWQMITSGRDGISHFSLQELDPSLPASMVHHKNYVPSRGVIDGDRFDHEFFKISRREALFIDPQQRVLLETCWQALEDAGWADRRQSVRIGVYAGVGANTYLQRNIMQGHAEPHSEEEYFGSMGNDKDYVATRIAYHLDLRGPAVSVHTACSTSLVAVIEGIKTLLTDEADMVLAGAASVNSPIASGHLYQEGGIFSRDGQCRPFSADATGTLFSDGSAVVLLKRLDKALADGDSIHAVIQGWAANNDGRNKSSFAAPSVDGQAQAIRKAYQRANWAPSSVSYMECHGTATPIGDPIEIEGLRKVFQKATADIGFCALGSVKANIGHLTAAAGTIGLIKAALVVQKAKIPAALHAYPLNPQLRMDQSPFYIPRTLQSWPQSRPRRAAVSSFGVGGTNAHILLEAFHTPDDPSSQSLIDPWVTVQWSAKDAASCIRYGEQYKSILNETGLNWHNLSFLTAKYRSHFNFRQSVTARSLAQGLQAIERLKSRPRSYPSRQLPLILVFPGQGSQYPQMGQALAQAWPRFAGHYQRTLQAFKDRFELDVAGAINEIADTGSAQLHSTLYTQPAIFSFEWALAQCLIDCGSSIDALIGHSIGEVSAAAIAGVLGWEDAIHLVYHRARAMQGAESGVMVAVRVDQKKLAPILPAGISICVINSTESCVIGGRSGDMEAFLPLLRQQSIAFKQLETSHAFHSSMMDPVLEQFRQALAPIRWQTPRIPIISTVDAQILSDKRVSSIEYWVQQIRQTVDFVGAIRFAAARSDAIFVETGPRDALSRFIQQILQDETRWPSLSLMQRGSLASDEEQIFTDALSELANHGIALCVAPRGRLCSAPVYPFHGERLWLDALPRAKNSDAEPTPGHVQNIAPPRMSEQSGLSVWTERLADSLAQISGLSRQDLGEDASWFNLGLDSLILTQWSLKLQKEWGINMSLNILQNQLKSLHELAQHMQSIMPQEVPPPQAAQPSTPSLSSPQASSRASSPDHALAVQQLIQQQISLMNKQVELLASMFASSPSTTASLVHDQSTSPTNISLQKAQQQAEFLAHIAIEGQIEFASDHGIVRLPHYRGSFLARDDDGQPGLFIENPEIKGEIWQLLPA